MTLYILTGQYSETAVKGMVAKPQDRKAAVSKLMADAGGKLHEYYVTFGESDFLVIVEFPSEVEATSALLVAAATGGVKSLKTTVAMTTETAMKAMKKAGTIVGGFSPAGA